MRSNYVIRIWAHRVFAVMTLLTCILLIFTLTVMFYINNERKYWVMADIAYACMTCLFVYVYQGDNKNCLFTYVISMMSVFLTLKLCMLTGISANGVYVGNIAFYITTMETTMIVFIFVVILCAKVYIQDVDIWTRRLEQFDNDTDSETELLSTQFNQ